jgi:hypothetical protein
MAKATQVEVDRPSRRATSATVSAARTGSARLAWTARRTSAATDHHSGAMAAWRQAS